MGETKTITNIQIQVKRKDRYTIFLDGEFAFGIHQDVLLKSGIGKGDTLTEKQINHVLFLERLHEGREKAFRLLAHRARSTKELRERLVGQGFTNEHIDIILADLQRLELVDDSKFAFMYARNRMATRPCGQWLLRRELEQKGISPEDITKACEEVFREVSERQVATELALKKKQKLDSLEPDVAQKRITSFLLRRGFHWDVIKEIIEAWDELNHDH